MLAYPEIDPIIFSLGPFATPWFTIGPLAVRWYGLMYVLGFTASYFLVRHQINRHSFKQLAKHFEDLNLVLILSVVIGGRFGYIVFYNLPYYLAHPLEIFNLQAGGLSFHGACFLLIFSGWLFTRKYKLDFWKSADIYVATIPIGLGLGRIGNFINGELYGRATDLPWGMIFPTGGPVTRHPSQLYEAFLEGIVLFTILWCCRNLPWKRRKYWPHGSILALFLICYGLFRSMVEFAREPDQQIGFLFGLLTMGQLLSTIMVVTGIILWVLRIKTRT